VDQRGEGLGDGLPDGLDDGLAESDGIITNCSAGVLLAVGVALAEGDLGGTLATAGSSSTMSGSRTVGRRTLQQALGVVATGVGDGVVAALGVAASRRAGPEMSTRPTMAAMATQRRGMSG
jgi:hypothetical protein